MVIPTQKTPRNNSGMLTIDLVVAMGILLLAVLPLSVSFRNERRLCRAYYLRTAALELVDGEMEKLAAGEWRHYATGTQPYPVKAGVSKNLRGTFFLTVQKDLLRLEWTPENSHDGGRVTREVPLP